MPKIKYGRRWKDGLTPLDIELLMFRDWSTEDVDSPGRFTHFQEASNLLLPDMVWNPWLEDQIKSLCEAECYNEGGQVIRNLSWVGCGTSGKTFASGYFGMVWWLACPDDSIVILTTTQKDMVRKRVWPVVQDIYTRIKLNIAKKHELEPEQVSLGHMIDSRSVLQNKQGDFKHAISAMAVRDGETQKAVANLKGQHAKRIMVVIDEASDCPEAIYATIPNLRKACQELIILSIANPASHYDPSGRVSEPLDGWNSINLESTRWQTRGVPEWQIPPGVCLRFRGSNSPNVTARRTIYSFLYTWEDYKASQGAAKDHVGFWKNDEGFWPPDGTCKTVFTEALIDKHNCFGKHEFKGKPVKVASLDPAFGGNRCILLFGELGYIEGGGSGLQVTESISVPLRPDTNEEVDYQIARYCIKECKARDVAPESFGTDATGIGRGVYAIMANEWSNRIRRVEFGGAPSEWPAGTNDKRPAKDVYDRRVTELWWWVRDMATSDRLRGLTREMARQLCLREYEMPGRKYVLETKEDFKARWGFSPDEADALAVLVEVAKLMGLRAPSAADNRAQDHFVKIFQAHQKVFRSVTYTRTPVLR